MTWYTCRNCISTVVLGFPPNSQAPVITMRGIWQYWRTLSPHSCDEGILKFRPCTCGITTRMLLTSKWLPFVLFYRAFVSIVVNSFIIVYANTKIIIVRNDSCHCLCPYWYQVSYLVRAVVTKCESPSYYKMRWPIIAKSEISFIIMCNVVK